MRLGGTAKAPTVGGGEVTLIATSNVRSGRPSFSMNSVAKPASRLGRYRMIVSRTLSSGSSFALALALLSSSAAFAQDTTGESPAPAEAVEQPEEESAADENPAGPEPVTEAAAEEMIIVTGSRVRAEAPVGSTVTALGRDDIEQSGRVTLDRVIKELPQVFDLGVSENSRGQSGGAGNIVLGNSINLRGIGPNATLIIVDGHRVVNNGRSTDPSILPTLGVERVEVIADGASAIYGSDAVAGVVNLIPRRRLDGVEAFARVGISDDAAYHECSAGAAAGIRFSRGQAMLAYEHVDRSNLNGFDRSFFVSDQTANSAVMIIACCAARPVRSAPLVPRVPASPFH